jgi:hypothetical protein
VAARIFSAGLLQERGVIQHDPDAVAKAVKALWALHRAGYLTGNPGKARLPATEFIPAAACRHSLAPCHRYEKIRTQLHYLSTELITADSLVAVKMTEVERNWLLERVVEILWLHPDIPLEHLQYIRGITLVEQNCWKRCQEWDNIFSFFDPLDQRIKIRRDQADNSQPL